MKNISVCIPTYNQGPYLQKAILSAYHQTLEPHEIIVSNDCSTDSTREILDELQLRIPILKVIHQPTNLGIAGNVNACLKTAAFDFILRLDSDDYLESNYCEVLAALLKHNVNAAYAHANVCEVDQYDNILKKRIIYRSIVYQNGDDALKASVRGYRVAANIIMFRRAALESVNYLANRPNFGEDYHLAADLAANGWGNVFSPMILSYYRVWTDAEKLRGKRKLKELDGLFRVFNDIIEPAFDSRKWNKQCIKKSRENFACSQANCLESDFYTKDEYHELEKMILAISCSNKTKKFIWLYQNGYGKYLRILEKMEYSLKLFIKDRIISKRKP